MRIDQRALDQLREVKITRNTPVMLKVLCWSNLVTPKSFVLQALITQCHAF